jgi:bacteriochlorophyll 4-vinyl reductase
MAKPCGQRICKQILEKVKTKEEALDEFSELVNEQNWGELSFIDVDFKRGSGKAIVKNSFEARKCQSKTPCCQFLANVMAGFTSELFAKNVMVKEEKCAASGNVHCEFKF